MKNATVSWINNKPTGKTIALSTTKVLENGLASLAGDFGFVTTGSVAAKGQFKLGQIIELPDTAKVVQKQVKQTDGTTKEFPMWTW